MTIVHLSSRVPLRYFPSRSVYITSCRCWRRREFVDLNPGGREMKGTLNFPDDWTLDSQFTEIGEALVAEDGLVHPDNPFESK